MVRPSFLFSSIGGSGADGRSNHDHRPGRSIISGELEDLKRQYQRIKVVFADGIPADIRWAQGADRIRKEGRMVSILSGRNSEEIMAQARALPGTSVDTYPVTLRELFLELMRAD